MSCVKCHVACCMSQKNIFLGGGDKGVKFVGGGSVINKRQLQLSSVNSIPKIDDQVVFLEKINLNDFHGPELHTLCL